MTLGALFAGKSEASSALGHFDRGSQKGLRRWWATWSRSGRFGPLCLASARLPEGLGPQDSAVAKASLKKWGKRLLLPTFGSMASINSM